MGCFDFCYFVTSHDTPSTNAPSIWCFGPTAIICLDGDSFNQRTQYMVLRVELEQSTTRLFLQPTHPIRGCFIPCLDRCVRQTTFNQRTPYGGASLTSRILLRIILPFNQRTQYGVLHANGNLITLYMNLQPTHPVCGASVSVDGQSQHISPSTNAPSMGCFYHTLQPWPWGNSFNQRTQYGVLHGEAQAILAALNLQPTHPVWGASLPRPSGLVSLLNLQPTHPVWGASRNLM